MGRTATAGGHPGAAAFAGRLAGLDTARMPGLSGFNLILPGSLPVFTAPLPGVAAIFGIALGLIDTSRAVSLAVFPAFLSVIDALFNIGLTLVHPVLTRLLTMLDILFMLGFRTVAQSVHVRARIFTHRVQLRFVFFDNRVSLFWRGVRAQRLHFRARFGANGFSLRPVILHDGLVLLAQGISLPAARHTGILGPGGVAKAQNDPRQKQGR